MNECYTVQNYEFVDQLAQEHLNLMAIGKGAPLIWMIDR